MNFDCRVSVIVPIYNQEPYLDATVKSLLAQTIDPEEMEILLIDDGSTDASPGMCDAYADSYSNVRVIHKKNGGLSDARNCGIDNARGRYLMYLDGDDKLRADTVKAVVDFFDDHYDEVDLVTYPSVTIKNGKEMRPHYRYNVYKESGVYDLSEEENIYAAVTRIEVCVKNLRENNVRFSDDRTFRHEDEKYCTDVILGKLKVGFCNKGAYYYEQQPEGLQTTYFHSYYLFENTMAFWEEEFGKFEGVVPRYLQALYVSDCAWKIKSDILFPYHYCKSDFDNAMGRLVALLARVDASVIFNHPALNVFQRAHLLQFAKKEVRCVPEAGSLSLFVNDECAYTREKIEIILLKTALSEDCVSFKAFLKSPCFQFAGKPKLYAVTRCNGGSTRKEIALQRSSWGHNGSKVEINEFWGFDYVADFKDVVSKVDLTFEVDYLGHTFETNYFFMPRAVFSLKDPVRTRLVKAGRAVLFTGEGFVLDPRGGSARLLGESLGAGKGMLPRCKPIVSAIAQQVSKRCRIWLYHDCHGVEKNNAYFQFVHDWDKNDGIERFYVVNDDLDIVRHLFTKDQFAHVLRFRSAKHKLMFLAAERIITAYVEAVNWRPCSERAMRYFGDTFHAKVTYLQHGVLHAHQPWKYSLDRLLIDEEVVSTGYEIENLMTNYNFDRGSLIAAGMPRYDFLDPGVPSERRILFAPSWRKYLVRQKADGQWLGVPSVFLSSKFYSEVKAFLESDNLARLLEKYDYVLDFKLHPILLEQYADCFAVDNPRIVMAPQSVNDESYAVFITDFSSYRFDFVYLKRPIIYMLPDKDLFDSGMCDYRKTDLPLDGMFGNLFTTAEETIEELERILERGSRPEDCFERQMDGFFLHYDCGQRERIYRALIGEKI